jgi:tetratricopeptide (TPR) repeat protein
MKVSRSLAISLSLLLLAGITLSTSSCGYVYQVWGKDKLNQGILKYNQGKTDEAMEFFESAAKFIPDRADVWLCLGAVWYKRMKGADKAEYEKFANNALQSYSKALELSGGNCKVRDNAIGYIATIHDELQHPDENKKWLLERTQGECATNEVKAGTFYAIAVKYWQCAYDESTRYADKAKLTTEPFHVRNFYHPPDKAKFDDCLAKSFEFIEKALAINPEYAEARSYKSLLYREKQKSTSAEADRKKFNDEAEKEAKAAIDLIAKAKAKAEAEAAAKAAAAAATEKK